MAEPGTVYFTVPQDQAVLLSREEVSGLIDEIYQMFKNHPGCEESTNKLLDELKNSTGYGVGTIRDVLEDFRKNGNFGVYQSEDRAGSAGNGTINISSRVRLEKDAALIMAEIIHSAGPKVAEFKLNWDKYHRLTDPHARFVVYFTDSQEGIRIEVNTELGVVNGVTYLPAAEDEHLRCPEQALDQERSGGEPAYWKIDEYGSISAEEQQARVWLGSRFS